MGKEIQHSFALTMSGTSEEDQRERERIIQGSGSPSPIIEEILKNFYFQ